MRHLFSAIFWSYCALSLTVWWFAVVIPWLLVLPFDRRRRFAHWYAYTWANHFHALSPYWQIEVRGADRVKPDQAYVMVANHESSADILMIFALKKQYRWVSKRANFFVPFLGWMMAMAGYVPIVRGDRKSREDMMRRCHEQLKMGNSIMMFPEGTRSRTTEMLPFKRGAFMLACDAKVPVVPVVLGGPADVLPRDSWLFAMERKMYPKMSVLEPIDPADFDYDAKALTRVCRERMQAERARLREELDAEQREWEAQQRR